MMRHSYVMWLFRDLQSKFNYKLYQNRASEEIKCQTLTAGIYQIVTFDEKGVI